MPTYEFRCPDGHEFEKFYRSIGGAESQAGCPVCGKPAERMMSAAGFAFKGSGFYLTDYGKNAHRGEAPPDAKTGVLPTKESADAGRSEGSGSDAASAKPEGAKAEGAKSGESSGSAGESKAQSKAESKAADAKPAPAAPKPSASE